MNLVLIETSGNQNYIFATNKLRENVGASELTYRAGKEYVRDAVSEEGGSGAGIKEVVAVSGKAILLVPDETVGKRVISTVTRRALKEAPGLDIRGVVGWSFEWDNGKIHEKIGEAHRLLEALRSRVPGPVARFQRLPVVAECSTSGLPAKRFAGKKDQLPEDERGPRSAESIAKQEAREGWHQRLQRLLDAHRIRFPLPDATTELEKLGCDWLAVIHADGNGLGQVFLGFDQFASGDTDYIDKLGRFSRALDCCTEKAFCVALSVLKPRGEREVLPIVPLVLGGDDLTVVCDGRQAMKFTKRFLDEFERLTGADSLIAEIMAQKPCQGKVTSCAGIAIVKPHFPFHAAYELAEELLRSAKELLRSAKKQKPRSAVDFHILYDASGPDLKRIRAQLTTDYRSTSLVARPYVLSGEQEFEHRRWQDLDARIQTVNAKENGRRRLPNSMLHELREGLFFGHSTADARLRLVRERYRNQGLDGLLGDTTGEGSLFWRNGEQRITALLDALDLAEFWEGQS
ncbi:MAG: Cas10/Cmr2 second palm domain-containing protein [Candidatus Sulfotelmatobacter sp.]